MFSNIHHIAIIASEYERSKHFYAEILGFEVVNETFRKERNSWKLDLQVNSNTQIELFTFPDPPTRTTNPEACGLRHLAFAVDDVWATKAYLLQKGISSEDIRTDETTGNLFFFFRDPDDLPLEVYQTA